MKTLLLFLTITISLNAQNDNDRIVNITSDFIDPVSLGRFNPTNEELFLTIESRYDECGEWGGHYEKTIVKSDSIGDIYAHYKKYAISCDSTYYYARRDEYKIKPTIEKIVLLNKEKMVALKKYSLELLQASFSERPPGHSGKRFRLNYKDNFQIEYNDYFSGQGFSQTYEEFLKSIGL